MRFSFFSLFRVPYCFCVGEYALINILCRAIWITNHIHGFGFGELFFAWRRLLRFFRTLLLARLDAFKELLAGLCARRLGNQVCKRGLATCRCARSFVLRQGGFLSLIARRSFGVEEL